MVIHNRIHHQDPGILTLHIAVDMMKDEARLGRQSDWIPVIGIDPGLGGSLFIQLETSARRLETQHKGQRIETDRILKEHLIAGHPDKIVDKGKPFHRLISSLDHLPFGINAIQTQGGIDPRAHPKSPQISRFGIPARMSSKRFP